MAKQKRKTDWEKRHRRNVSRYQREIEALYEEAARQAALLGGSVGDLAADTAFSFETQPALRKRADRLLSRLYSDLYGVILDGIKTEWTLANNKNSELARMVFGDNIGKLTKEQYARYFSTNGAACDAFTKRKVAGLNLSDRVWNYTNQFKGEIETVLDIGIHSGRSADELSQDLRGFLKHPDTLFRRVKTGVDENGEPIYRLSKAAEEFHPGQGVYRSSYKNARRLAATETNIAYRTADHERWQDMDFIVGIRICLSNNHTLNGVPFTDICDELKGDYPKDFKFTGWHPHCRCHVETIMKSQEELDADLDRMLNGEEPTEGSVNEVKDVPENFKKWIADNGERIERAEQRGTIPYFMRDNESYWKQGNGLFGSVFSDQAARLKPTEIMPIDDIRSKVSEIASNHPEYFSKGFGGIEAVAEESRYMSTTMDGVIKVNFATDENGFNAGESLVSAFGKLASGGKLTRNEEYSIEVLWHEILHNKSLNTAILPPVEVIDKGFARTVAETINQLDARHTYGTLLTQLGGKPRHNSWVLEHGYGYNETVGNLRMLLNAAKIDERDFVRRSDAILMKDYTDIDTKIGMLLKDMYNGNSDIRRLFGMIERKDFANLLKILN